MRMRLFGAVILSAGIAAVVLAQQPRPGGGGGGFNASASRMLGNKTVQEELKLTDDQLTQVKALNEKVGEIQKEMATKGKDITKEERQEAFTKISAEADKVVKDLKPEQTARLKQLQLQVIGVNVFTMPEDAVTRFGLADEVKKITLTDDQKEKFKETADARGKDMQELKGKDADTQKKREALAKEYQEKFVGILTPDQKKTWTELTGKAVEIKFENAGFGGKGGKPKEKPKDPNE